MIFWNEFTIFPATFTGLAEWTNIGASSMHISSLELTFIVATVIKDQSSLASELIVFIFSFVDHIAMIFRFKENLSSDPVPDSVPVSANIKAFLVFNPHEAMTFNVEFRKAECP